MQNSNQIRPHLSLLFQLNLIDRILVEVHGDVALAYIYIWLLYLLFDTYVTLTNSKRTHTCTCICKRNHIYTVCLLEITGHTHLQQGGKVKAVGNTTHWSVLGMFLCSSTENTIDETLFSPPDSRGGLQTIKGEKIHLNITLHINRSY